MTRIEWVGCRNFNALRRTLGRPAKLARRAMPEMEIPLCFGASRSSMTGPKGTRLDPSTALAPLGQNQRAPAYKQARPWAASQEPDDSALAIKTQRRQTRRRAMSGSGAASTRELPSFQSGRPAACLSGIWQRHRDPPIRHAALGAFAPSTHADVELHLVRSLGWEPTLKSTEIDLLDTDRAVLARIAQLSAEERDAILVCIRTSRTFLDPAPLAAMAEAVHITPPEAGEWLDVLASPLLSSEESKLTLEQLPAKILEHLREKGDLDESLDGNALVSFLSSVFANQRFGLLAKADELYWEFDQVYSHSRILTDIRPVFIPQTRDPGGAIITHTMRLRYLRGNERQTLSLAIDRSDLAQLHNDIARALEKDDNLRHRFDGTISFFDVEVG